MRLAYADPPYPGKAHLYPENTEVDHVELIGQLQEYDGWALSTDETNLAYVLSLCPPKTRVLAWCRPNIRSFGPYPYQAWEPVLCRPARTDTEVVRSYVEASVVTGHMRRENYVGQKARGVCEWVVRCLGAKPDDNLDDLYPGSGIMGRTFEDFGRQLSFAIPKSRRDQRNPGGRDLARMRARIYTTLPGLEPRNDQS